METLVPSALAPVQRGNLAAQVFVRLRKAIVLGELKPGAALSEPALAGGLGVSRAPLREALIALEREGLIEFDERGRTRVCSLTEEDVAEIISMRAALETLAASLAAARWNQEYSKVVEENIRQQKSAPTLAELTRLDADLHEYVVRAAGHRRLLASWLTLRPQLEWCLGQIHRLQDTLTVPPREETVNAHRNLLAALAGGKPKVAADVMAAHIESWHEWLPTAFPVRGEGVQRRDAEAALRIVV
jgi:DNA-binding GntR family transcriptional regulator